MRKNANEIIFDEIIVLGTPALFTDWRVDRVSVPTDMKMYEVRHADEDWGDPCQLARGILVDFYGTILTLQPLALPACGYLNFDSGKDWGYIDDDPCATVTEFRSKYAGKEE